MTLAKAALSTLMLVTVFAVVAHAGPIEEHATGGNLDLVWHTGWDTPTNNMAGATLDPAHPAYNNPSGDHTVAVATTAYKDSGGIIETMVDPQGVSDYSWEGWIFTGEGDTRRGFIVRGDPADNFKSCYQFVIDPLLTTIKFRKFVNGVRITPDPRAWAVTVLPQFPDKNQWHHMKVTAAGDQFRCYWDGFELTSDANGPIVDATLQTGWVGCYNFWPTLSYVDAYFDDLFLRGLDGTVAAKSATWGSLKARYR